MEEQRKTTVPTKLRSMSSGSDPRLEDDESLEDSSKRCTINNINVFIANVFLLNMARTALRAYLGGSIRTIERRFGFQSSSSGLILGLTDVMHIVCVLFLGYCGRKSHKPRLMAITSIFSAATGLLMAAPYFILANEEPLAPPFAVQAMFNGSGPRPELMGKIMEHPGANISQLHYMKGQPGIDPTQLANQVGKAGANPGPAVSMAGGPPGKNPNPMASMKGKMPFGPLGRMQMCGAFGALDPCKMAMRMADQNTMAYALFIVASLLYGVGGPSTMVLGVPYIDEHAPRTKTDFCIGLITASFALGPVFGLFLAAGCMRISEDLQQTGIDPMNPQFFGAWWLGFGLLGLLILVLSAMMFLYPKHMAGYPLQTPTKPTYRTPSSGGMGQTLKGLPRSIMHMLRNRFFLIILLSEFFLILMMCGILMNGPRYMEVHFLIPAYKANIIAGSALGITALVGSLLGGALVAKLKLKLLGLGKMMLICCGTILFGAIIGMFLVCPKVDMGGDWDAEGAKFSIDGTCNKNCSCIANKMSYNPVCGADGKTYFSACYAGCRHSANESFYDCGCVEGGTAQKGLCLGQCSMIIPFAMVGATLSLCMTLNRVAIIMAVLRVVPTTDRSLGISINSFVINLFGLLPGPIIFGYLIDTTCQLWQNTCGKTGSCLLFDSDKFRLRTFGPSVAFVLCTFVLYIVFVVLVKKKSQETRGEGPEKLGYGTAHSPNQEALLDVNKNEKNANDLPETDL